MSFPGGYFISSQVQRRGVWQGPGPPEPTTGASRAGSEGCGACRAPQWYCGSCAGRHTPPAASRALFTPWDPAPRGRPHVRSGRTAFSPGGTRQGKRKGLGPCAPALAPRAWVLGPRPSPSTPSRSGRRQSSRPPPPPPAIPESWQRRGQRTEGERRRSPCEPQPAGRATPTAPASAQKPSCHRLLFRGGVVSFRILLVGRTTGSVRTGKGRGGLF